MEPIGRKHWAIAEGCVPSQSSFSRCVLICHETARTLKAVDRDAHARVTVFFVDREPVGPCDVTATARPALHLRFNDLKDPAPIPAVTHAARFASRRAKPAFNDGLYPDVTAHCRTVPAGTQSN